MALLLSVPEFLSQHPEVATQTEAVRSPWKIPLHDPSGRSYGYRQEVNLRPGLNVLIDDYTLQEDLVVETGEGKACLPSFALEMSMMLSGNNRLEGVRSHQNFLAAYWEETDGGQFNWQAGERILKLDIHIDADAFESLVGTHSAPILPDLNRICQCDRKNLPNYQPFLQLTTTTKAMRSTVQQLLNCPYEGPTRWLYWEGKVLELIALRLEQGLEQITANKRKKRPALQADDIDRIHYARDILHQRLVQPPSLLELARLVELNDYKLKIGFQQVFGTTVFGYLTQQRMNKARQLLAQQQSVTSVAIAVGYTSPTAFSSAFKRVIGVSPKRYQLGKYKIVS